jgi:hypothetical protein
LASTRLGPEFYSESTVVRPYFRVEGLREKEEAGGGSGWDARKKKSEFLQPESGSITIAKGRGKVLPSPRLY